MDDLREFVIEDGILKRYLGSGGDVVVPEGVTAIDADAFRDFRALTRVELPEKLTWIGESAFYGCTSLKEVILPETLETICTSAFMNCRSLLKLTIPASVSWISKGEVFWGCDQMEEILVAPGNANFTSADGVLMNAELTEVFYCPPRKKSVTIPVTVSDLDDYRFGDCCELETILAEPGHPEYTSVDGILMDAEQTTVIRCPRGRIKEVKLPDSVTRIGDHAFAYCEKLSQLDLPQGVIKVGKGAFYGCCHLEKIGVGKSLKLDTEQFGSELIPAIWNQLEQLEPNMSGKLIKRVISDKRFEEETDLTLQANMFLNRQDKTVTPAYKTMIRDPGEFGEELLRRLDGNLSVKNCNAVGIFLELFGKSLSDDVLMDIYGRLKKNKHASKAIQTLSENVDLAQRLSRMLGLGYEMSCAEQKVMEHLCSKKMTVEDLNRMFLDRFGKVELPELFGKDKKPVRNMVLEWLLLVHEAYEQDPWNVPGVCPAAAEVLAELDPTGFHSVIVQLAHSNLGTGGLSKKVYLAYPICRYADETLMKELTGIAPRWASKKSGENTAPLLNFRRACVYSETQAAMQFADKYHDLDAYAKIRSTDADTIRDQYLSDVGINEQGERTYDLGNQTVVAKLQPDLSFLVLTRDGRIMKSIPKKNADPEKYNAANEDFIEMKKAAKKIVKNRGAVLFEDFLSGRSRKAEDWQKAYLHNPLLRSVAKLVIWKQGGDAFILNDSGPITSSGADYHLNSIPVSVAHPMEMEPEEVTAWQKYFTSHGLKQPFEQVWEPVLAPSDLRPDRYKGCMIPYYRFRSMDKHGIYVEDRDYHNDITISFHDCDTDVERIDWKRHEIDNDDRFEVKNFYFKKYTRQVNHIVGYLDRITIYDRIRKDDTSIKLLLPNFTLAQITEFIKIAVENNCTSVTALLLNYKNEHFSDFDPMDEFILE